MAQMRICAKCTENQCFNKSLNFITTGSKLKKLIDHFKLEGNRICIPCSIELDKQYIIDKEAERLTSHESRNLNERTIRTVSQSGYSLKY